MPAASPGIATEDALDPKPKPPEDAVTPHGLQGILRACRRISTSSHRPQNEMKRRGNGDLVKPDQEADQPAHVRSVRRWGRLSRSQETSPTRQPFPFLEKSLSGGESGSRPGHGHEQIARRKFSPDLSQHSPEATPHEVADHGIAQTLGRDETNFETRDRPVS
jgi:hypothetical protein